VDGILPANRPPIFIFPLHPRALTVQRVSV
jgi:hypothetical protein